MCDTLVVVRPDRVWFAKNSDRDPNEAQIIEWHPRQSSAPGTILRCTWIEIPQVEQTHAVVLSRPFWMWGAEMGANEHGVVIGNEAVFTNQPLAATGLTGMDLVRLGLERASTARSAIETVTELRETAGQGGGCGHEDRRFTYHNSFLVADPGEACVLETAGRYWATEWVRGARSISNGLSIPGFADRHADWLRGKVAACQRRRARTQTGAEQCRGLGDLMATLRDHGGDSTAANLSYSPINGALTGPCAHAGGLVAATQTTASWVAELHPGRQEHWVTGTAAPCLSLFKPIAVSEPLDLGPTPTDRFDERCRWWRHERLHRHVMFDLERLGPLFLPERNRLEAEWLGAPPTPADAWREADLRLAYWWEHVAQVSAVDRRPWWVRRYWRRRNQASGLPEIG
ncbi:MAG TPA: C69 family dipeptidase [Gemmatales bacterium]|nr:C69 family dipeptidase [Gemmatales bacterium]